MALKTGRHIRVTGQSVVIAITYNNYRLINEAQAQSSWHPETRQANFLRMPFPEPPMALFSTIAPFDEGIIVSGKIPAP
ncbi:MAG TPA: hypothetical protein VFO39_23545 [Candidatus Sulfotelmatobacter sp.]|nr:hypothetical protein [Candidatus Sulfotelmatobacter sp.]